MEDAGVWAQLGLSRLQTETYLTMLANPSVAEAGLCASLDCDAAELRFSLDALADLRLLRRVGDEVELVEPQVAITALARRRQSVLDEAPLVALTLADQFRRARLQDEPDGLFELVRGRDRIVSRILSFINSASTSVDWTSTPPYVAGIDSDIDAAELDLLARGVRMRGVYDASVLESGAHMDNVQSMIDRGEQARLVPAMRTKLLIVDSSSALIPFIRIDENNEPIAMVISHSPLSEALQRLFDFYWQTGEPVQVLRSDAASLRTGSREHRLLTLLSNGLSDVAIARQLDISERTLRRRIAALQLEWSAASRFQLGMIAQRRGLVD